MNLMRPLALAFLSVFASSPVVVIRPAPPGEGPAATVQLGEVFNRNWKADSYESPDGPVSLGTQFDDEGNAYLSVLPPHAMVATYYEYKRGMRGSWAAGGETYDVNLDVSIFRERTSNWVVVRRRSDRAVVFRQRIRELLLKTYRLGRSVSVSGREYRLFFSHGVLRGDPVRTDPQSFTLALVTDIGEDGGLEFLTYIIPFSHLDGGGFVTFELYEGRRVRLRALKETGELEIYLP